MRHALAILKYVPAVLCATLLVLWLMSLEASYGITINSPSKLLNEGSKTLSIFDGSVHLWHHPYQSETIELFSNPPSEGRLLRRWAGTLECGPWSNGLGGPDHFGVAFPIPAMLIIWLPVAIGPFTRFRFPLWSYFAWTALIAVELAYYLK